NDVHASALERDDSVDFGDTAYTSDVGRGFATDRRVGPIRETEYAAVIDRKAHHFLVAVLKDVQRQERTGKQDGCERKYRNFFKLLGTLGHDEGIVARPEPGASARASGPTSSDMCF